MSPRLSRFIYACSLLTVIATGVALAWGGVNAWRDGRGPNRLIVPLALERTANAQVFYDRGLGLRGEDCTTVGVAGGTRIHDVAFAVPRVPLLELRFDPMPFAGRFEVGQPRLETASGRVIAKFPLSAVVARNQIADLHPQGDHLVGSTPPGADDPQLTFGLGGPLRVGGPRLPWVEALLFAGALLVARQLRRQPANAGWNWWGELKNCAGEWGTGAPPGAIVVGALLVAAVECRLLWPLHLTMDWPLWDEAGYAARGAAWAQTGGALGELNGSPLYVASYAVLTRLGDLATAIFAQHYLVKLVTTVLLYLILARWWRSWVAAAAVALWWGGGAFQLEFPLLVYQHAWMWFLLALVLADRWPLAALGFALVATCARQEYQFAAGVLAVWLVWRLARDRWNWRGAIARPGARPIAGAILAGLALAIAGGVSILATWRGDSSRLWFAFQQHYAVRAVAAGQASGIDPWLDFGTVVQRDFPGAQSLGDAWRINHGAVLEHFAYNLTHAPLELVALGEPDGAVRGAGFLLVAAVLALAVRPQHGDGAGPAGECSYSRALALGGLLAIVPGLVVLAKGAYLLAAVPLAIGLAGRWLRWLAGRGGALIAGGSLVVLLSGAIYMAGASRVFVPGERPRPAAETFAVLKRVWPADGRHVLLGTSASSFAGYLGENRCDGVEVFLEAGGVTDFHWSLAARVAQTRPYGVLVTDYWHRSNRYDAKEIARVLAPPEWKRYDVPLGELYVRAGALEKR